MFDGPFAQWLLLPNVILNLGNHRSDLFRVLQQLSFLSGSRLVAPKISSLGTSSLCAKSGPTYLRQMGVSIHVGGVYESTTSSTGYATTGSKGCFTVTGGGDAAKAFGADISKRLDANAQAVTGTKIDVTVQKRDDVNKTFKVNSYGTQAN